MTSRMTLAVSLLLGAGLFSAEVRAQTKGSGGNGNQHYTGQAANYRSGDGSANRNGQWSADPTRGWVRTEKRQELRKSSGSSKSNSDKGKHNGNKKTKGY